MPHASFRPTASLPAMRLRAGLLKQVRSFFDSRGFLEVETPLLSADTVVDAHIDPVPVAWPGGAAGAPQKLWLQTSPEFCMKRLLAAGSGAIYQICKAFRSGESGSRHNPEFTMLEWYRDGDDLDAGMRLLSSLAEEILQTKPAALVTYRDAFMQYAGIDPFTATDQSLAELGSQAAPEFHTSGPLPRDEWLNLLLAVKVEPHLGCDGPTILYHYPASQAALAKVSGEPAVAARFELYINGVELANGYDELLEPAELTRRSQANNLIRQANGQPLLPVKSQLTAAMQAGLPACSGCALGFDRLVMLAGGYTSLDQVLAFPIDRA